MIAGLRPTGSTYPALVAHLNEANIPTELRAASGGIPRPSTACCVPLNNVLEVMVTPQNSAMETMVMPLNSDFEMMLGPW